MLWWVVKYEVNHFKTWYRLAFFIAIIIAASSRKAASSVRPGSNWGDRKCWNKDLPQKQLFGGTQIWVKWLWNNCNWFFGKKRLQWLTSQGEKFVIPSFNSFLTRAGWLWMAILSPWPFPGEKYENMRGGLPLVTNIENCCDKKTPQLQPTVPWLRVEDLGEVEVKLCVIFPLFLAPLIQVLVLIQHCVHPEALPTPQLCSVPSWWSSVLS